VNECVFCQIVSGNMESWKVYETDTAYAFLDINPVNDFHTLVIPKKHYTNIFDVSERELLNVMSALKHVADLYATRLGMNDLQIVNSSGVHTQQDQFHLHFHIVPRHEGDGQDIEWSPSVHCRGWFDTLLARLM
jgi:histidine triad (HIT) family protein